MQKDERILWELTADEIQQLRSVKTLEDLKDVKFIRTWMKDGLPAVAIAINGIEMCFDYLDTEDAAALMNPNFTDSKNTLLKKLRLTFAEGGAELNDEDEFEQEEYQSDSYGDGGSWG